MCAFHWPLSDTIKKVIFHFNHFGSFTARIFMWIHRIGIGRPMRHIDWRRNVKNCIHQFGHRDRKVCLWTLCTESRLLIIITQHYFVFLYLRLLWQNAQLIGYPIGYNSPTIKALCIKTWTHRNRNMKIWEHSFPYSSIVIVCKINNLLL